MSIDIPCEPENLIAAAIDGAAEIAIRWRG
jgi:hypothetical protein